MDRLVVGGPWFRRNPQWAALVIAALFAVVTTARVLWTNEADATGLLYALPVALAAMAFGRTVGVTAAVSAAGLLAAWVTVHPDESLSLVGWASRLVPLLLLGLLVGSGADAVEQAADDRLALAVAETRRRDAAEVHDGIFQRLAVAKWRLEAGTTDEASVLLDEAMGECQQLVTSLLEDVALEDRLQVKPPSGSAA